jgi:hypothetical protein
MSNPCVELRYIHPQSTPSNAEGVECSANTEPHLDRFSNGTALGPVLKRNQSKNLISD